MGKGLRNLSWNQFLFGLVLLRPPLFIFLGLSGLLMLVSLCWFPQYAGGWLSGFFLFITGFVVSLVCSKADPRIIRSLYGIPAFVFYQVRALFKSLSSRRLTVATREGSAPAERMPESRQL